MEVNHGMLMIGLSLFVLSTFITGLMRRVAIRKSILDIPNERSSHSHPTPRGGGIAIVITFLLALLTLHLLDQIDTHLFWVLTLGGTSIALLGYRDDVTSVNTRTRILLHFLIAGVTLFALGGYHGVHGIGSALALIGIVWCINFYNFMDGIDGLASSEGMIVALGAALALSYLGAVSLAWVCWLLANTIAGFMVWNWPPAKIFMGDVGSSFLGYVFAVLGLFSVNHAILPLAFWWLILAIFIWDATFTVVYRGMKGKKWYSAHREHAYQRMTMQGLSHQRVTLLITAMNIAILLPAAFLTVLWPSSSPWLVGISAFSLWLAWKHITSQPQHESTD